MLDRAMSYNHLRPCRLSPGRPEHRAVLAYKGPALGLCQGGRHRGVGGAGGGGGGLPLLWAGR